MKNIITALLFTFIFVSYGFTDTWQDKWVESALLLKKGDFNEAKKPLNEAIAMIENDEALNIPYVYVDRARLNLLLDADNNEVLADIEKALSSETLFGYEKLRAIVTKIIVNSRLENYNTLFDDIKAFADIQTFPLFDVTEKLIGRNVPKSEYYEKLMTCYLIHSGYCYDSEDCSFLKSHVLVAETHCGCQKCIGEYAKTRECDACSSIISPTKENVSKEELIMALIKYCAKEVKQLDDQIAIITAVCQFLNAKTNIELFPDTFENIFRSVAKPEQLYFD